MWCIDFFDVFDWYILVWFGDFVCEVCVDFEGLDLIMVFVWFCDFVEVLMNWYICWFCDWFWVGVMDDLKSCEVFDMFYMVFEMFMCVVVLLVLFISECVW